MTEPCYVVTPDAIRSYAAMHDIPLTETEATELSPQLAGGFAGIATLWRVDVGTAEPSVILPIDRR
jgi:hypothetical protein